MFARGSSKERNSTRKVTPPSPSYMSSEQFGMQQTNASRGKRTIHDLLSC
jgi:hypothetical protein